MYKNIFVYRMYIPTAKTRPRNIRLKKQSVVFKSKDARDNKIEIRTDIVRYKIIFL